jgi:hypothetical protein
MLKPRAQKELHTDLCGGYERAPVSDLNFEAWSTGAWKLGGFGAWSRYIALVPLSGLC